MSFGKRAPWTVNINSTLHQQILYSASLNVYPYMRKIMTLQWFPANLGENTAWDFVLRKEYNGENSIWKCKDFLPQSELVRAPMKKIKVNNF